MQFPNGPLRPEEAVKKRVVLVCDKVPPIASYCIYRVLHMDAALHWQCFALVSL